MKLSEMKQILDQTGIQLSKSLGQNFLHDGNQLSILRERFEHGQAGEEPDSGRSKHFAAKPKLLLIEDDALKYLKREPRDWSGWKLVANLPYAVASPLLVELAWARLRPERMIATLQIEVAKRLMAKPNSPDYGVLTLLVQLDYEPLDWFKIPAGCFFPQPEIDSACVVLARRNPLLLAPEQHDTFARIVKRSFSQRRKMMVKLLKEDWTSDRLGRAFAAVPLAAQTRGEAVSLEQFVTLTKCLHE
jgi:16S rRNA (adenine1518-N6/adenine1519-N6)-dimethyltransferase